MWLLFRVLDVNVTKRYTTLNSVLNVEFPYYTFNFSYGKISYKLAMEYVSNFCANLWQKLAYILADFGNKFIRNIYHIISTDIYDKQYFVLFLHLRERENNIRPVNHINLLLKCVTLSRLTWDIGMCFQFLTPFHDVLMISFSWVTNVIASTRKRFVFICAVIILQSLNKVFNNQDCVKSPTRGSLPWLL